MNEMAIYRARVGQAVGDRLSRVPGIFKLPVDTLDVFVLRDFLNKPECDALIAMIDKGREPSQLLSNDPDPEFRTSESCNLDAHDPFVKSIEAKITKLMGIEPSHGETIQGQRYAVGQQFKPHHDFFFTSEPYWPELEKTGGQRTWTAMMFLNVPEEGGQTFFDKAGVRVTPRTGNLLTWNNMGRDGEPNDFSRHQGMPVLKGVKYVITKWYRERPWGARHADDKWY